MNPEQEPGEVEFGLLMPFVVCRSQGGPYDDSAFVAGASFGAHMALLEQTKPEEWAAYVDPQMLRQYDLLAMHGGYKMESEPWDEHPDEWALVRFVKSDGGAPPVTEGDA